MPAVLGLSFGSGIIVYQIAKAAGSDGLARIEIGRSQVRHRASPSFLPSFALSLSYIFVVETPLTFNMTAMLGLTAYDSGDEDTSPEATGYYCLRWTPSVRRVVIIYYASIGSLVPRVGKSFIASFYLILRFSLNSPNGPQESVRFHTIDRGTGKARVWEVGLTFSCQLTINAFDEGPYARA